MTSRPLFKLNGTPQAPLAEREIELQDDRGAVNLKSRRNRKKLRQRQMRELRHKMFESALDYLRAQEVSQQKQERASLVDETLQMLEGVLRRSLEEPRASGGLKSLQESVPDAPRPQTVSTRRNHALFEIDDTKPLPKQVTFVREKPPVVHQSDGYVTAESAQLFRPYHPEVVLYSPQIPPNTGTVARLCAAMSARLHLIEPLGFEISDKTLRRAGLDYWEHVDVTVHSSWDDFIQTRPDSRLIFIETGVTDAPGSFAFEPGDLLVFGSETKGIPQSILQDGLARPHSHILTIPMFNRGVRSINLANSVSIVLHQAIAVLHDSAIKSHC